MPQRKAEQPSGRALLLLGARGRRSASDHNNGRDTETRVDEAAHQRAQPSTRLLGRGLRSRTVLIGALGCLADRNLRCDRRDDEVGEAASRKTATGHGLHGTAVASAARQS